MNNNQNPINVLLKNTAKSIKDKHVEESNNVKKF